MLSKLVAYSHKAAFSPVPSTWIDAIGSTGQKTTTLAPANATQPIHTKRMHDVFATQIQLTCKLATDQTCRFPYVSSRGAKYIMITHEKDYNTILTGCLANRTAAELTRTYTAIYTYLTLRGLKLRLQIMDNECPEKLQKFMRNTIIAYQLVPPNYHRHNPAEKAIGT
mmetsp:Transcript_9700/g.9359  ORF Transcript_9700/g.9359 Transcript_9700/m.9359 type:complete len:168 (-) Transcript_9700:190-693(-)